MTQSSNRIRVWLGGHLASAEMQSAVEQLRAVLAARGRMARMRRFDELDQISDALSEESPELIVVFQNRPREFRQRCIHQLLANSPMQRLVVCQGVWCESSGRSVADWPEAVRVRAAQFANRIHAELDVLDGLRRPLPLTGSLDEVFAFENFGGESLQRTAVEIVSPDPETRELVADIVRASGGRMVTGDAADLVLIDIDPWSPLVRRRLTAAIERNVPVYAIAALCDIALRQRLLTSGVRDVLPRLTLARSIPATCNSMSRNAIRPESNAVGR